MNPTGPAATNRPILVVLSLILVCLVLLVVRAYVPATKPVIPPPVATVETPRERPRGITFVPAPGNELGASAPSTASAGDGQVPTSAENPGTAYDTVPDPGSQPIGLVLPPLPASGAGVAPGGGHGGSVAHPKDLPEIVGTVTLRGTPKPEIPIDLGPNCGRLNTNRVTTRHYVVNSEGRLANVLVYIAGGLKQKYPIAPGTPLLEQVGCMFQPYVMGVQSGQKFHVRNSDPEMHNLHFTPCINREFNFSQGIQGQVNDITLDKPELFVRIKCDVHPWEFAYVSVLDHPFFAVTDANGEFRLPRGFPAGKYFVHALHHKADLLAKEIFLAPGERKTIHFVYPAPLPAEAGNPVFHDPVVGRRP